MRRYVVAAAAVALAAAVAASAEDEQAAPGGDQAESDQGGAAAQVDAPLAVEAGGYAVYQEDVSALEEKPFGSLADIDKGLEVVASHHPERLARSWIAYSALVAAQSPEFVDGVRQTADYYGRDAVLAGLRNDPSYAGQVTGAESARQAVLAAVANDASRLRAASATVKEQAYSLQNTNWAGARSGDNSARIAHLEEVAQQPRDPSGEILTVLAAPGAVGSDRLRDRDAAALRESFWSAFRLGPSSALAATPNTMVVGANPTYKGVLDAVVTLAAFEALDAANDADAEALSPLLDQIDTRQCMTMARLHFKQCIAASHFRFEDPFCIAEHGIEDIGDCFSNVMASADASSHGAIPTGGVDAAPGEDASEEVAADVVVEASAEEVAPEPSSEEEQGGKRRRWLHVPGRRGNDASD